MEADLEWLDVTAAFRPSAPFPDPPRILRHRCGWPLVAAIGLAACSEPSVPLAPAPAVDAQATIAHERLAAATKPVRETPSPAPARTVDARGLTLLGTTIGARGAFAVVRRDGSPQSFQVRVGDAVDGRVVTAIDFDRIVLASDTGPGGGAAAPVRLDIAGAAPSPPEPTAKAPPPATGDAAPIPIYTEPEIVVAGH